MYFRFSRNKKGNAPFDVATILIIIVALGITSIFGYKIFDELNSDFQNSTDITDSTAIATSQDMFDKYPSLLDNIFAFAFVLLMIFTIISVFMIDSHPIFFIITVIMLISVFLVAILLGNTFDDLMGETVISSYANSFPYTSWIMQHILTVMVAVGFVISIALFVKFKMM